MLINSLYISINSLYISINSLYISHFMYIDIFTKITTKSC